ncbi:AMY1.6 [Symbiodinium necroappetens]|uniref:AMY1.6 protein n=1 Tax=Symbiodinium necroappetens TaxID=1628268 RepID=A0A812NWP8_9DINO|nr:AMY1.6 [Symbiodinium necroappetens]
MEWLVGHFGPQIDIRFLLYRPQLVPALRRCVDFGLELPKSGLQADAELSEAPDRASTPSCRPVSRVGLGSRASTRPPSSAQSPSPLPRPDWHTDGASEAEARGGREQPLCAGLELMCRVCGVCGVEDFGDAEKDTRQEWGFERGHGPFPGPARRRPASQWGFERRHSVREDGPDRWVSKEAAGVPFAASSSPTYDSSLMAMAVGALQTKEADKDRLLFAERTVGLFQALSPPRGPAGALVRGGCRAFADHARAAWDEYRADVQHFQNTVYRCRGGKSDKERLRRPMSANHAAVSARLYKPPASRPRTF